ncbi:alpha/beta hydrolase [Nisaea sp.]|uniref:alpha/beta fold hydrolase n=1 Tax=Nisaea sp. TaxID=2024842 RepID=UPI00326637AF
MIPFEALDAEFLPGFERMFVEVDGNPVRTLVGGEGPPVLLLHGDPQTHLCWHHVAPHLAKTRTVVITDLRGRGESHKPEVLTNPEAYSKRAMAAEQCEVMEYLSFSRFDLVGHDRGARVAQRLALDYPQAVSRLAILDIVPTLDLYEGYTAAFAQDYFYFNFLTQPAPLPERLIEGDPHRFMRQILLGLSDETDFYEPRILDVYLAAASTPEAIRATCDCFRAGYYTDLEHDRSDRETGRTIDCPTLIAWGEKGPANRHFDMQAVWRRWCTKPYFAPMPSGHFIPEEAADEICGALSGFLTL